MADMESNTTKGKSWKKDREKRKKPDTIEETCDNSLCEEKSAENIPKEGETEELKENEAAEMPQQEEATISKEDIEAEERATLSQFIMEQETRIAKRQILQEQNLGVFTDRVELNTSKLDSTLKKNTAFIKKMRTMTESQHASLEKELLSLNLSKYVSEVAQAIVDAKLKMADVPTAVHLCSLLHQRYSDFSPLLLQIWHKIFNVKKDEKAPNLSKLRVDLRLFAELVSAGIFLQKEGLPMLGNLLTTLVNSDKDDHQYMSVLLTFCRHCGDDYMGLVSRKFRVLAEKYEVQIPKSSFLRNERQKNVRGLLKEYFTTVVKHLINDHKELNKVEQYNYRMLQTRGELTEKRKNLAENLTAALLKLLANTHTLADLLDEDVPEMPEIKTLEEEDIMVKIASGGDIGDAVIISHWEDDDTRAFYTSLPQLKAILPSILYSESEKTTSSMDTEKVDDDEENIDELDDSAKPEDETEEIQPPEVSIEDDPEETSQSTTRVILEGFLNSLPNCISRDLIDSAALEFCLKLNTKPNRRRLVKAIFLVPRTRLDLLPFYSRLVASLQPLMPDLATDVANMLKQDFRYKVRKKDQINIESKIKIARFIGELVKFSIFPRNEALICLRMLLQDFKHHHIEMACNLLETCGRLLYRTPDSHHRTRIYLEQMMRKKTVSAFDPRYNTMIENAFYYVNPPETNPDGGRPERPPMHQYIRSLLYDQLSKSNTEKIFRQIRKLNWEDETVANYVIKCLTCVGNAKFYNIRCIANLLAGLISYHDWVGPAVVDGVLEDIRFGMEVNETKFNQRRISSTKYLGELYNYRIIESSVIFKVLYSLLTFGVSWEVEIESPYDPPGHLMRLRLVCTMLDTCGQFFSSGSSKKRLDCFLVYFQLYYQIKRFLWTDSDFPWQIDHLVQDSITSLRPKAELYKNLSQSQEAVNDLNQQIVKKAMQLSPDLKFLLEEDQQSDNFGGLETIPESDDLELSVVTDEIFLEADDEEEELPRKMSLEGEWGEYPRGESLTPSQHSQPLKGTADDNEEPSCPEEGSFEAKECDVNIVLKKVDCLEDNDFMSAFDHMMADNLLERTREAPRSNQSYISVPVKAKSAKKNYDQILSEQVEEEKTVVNFVLLTRGGNKPLLTNVEMPVDSEIVNKLKSNEEEERAERDRVKQLTLEINERQEEEEAFERLQQVQKQSSQNLNRERRPRYQHPKGAPDADLIFGSKKVR